MDLFSPIVAAIYSLAVCRDQMKCAEYLSACRTQLDPFIFQTLSFMYSDKLNTFWNEYTIPKQSDKAIVIVERRAHPNLQFCLQNAAYFCRGYAIHIVCSKANETFVKIALGAQKNNVHIHPYFEGIGTPSQGYAEYNELLKTKEFWSMFPEEHIITLETDCYFLNYLPDKIYNYDYVAAKWPWLQEEPGGGGLTYRKRSMMLNICDTYKTVNPDAQDAFVSNAVKEMGYKYPNVSESMSLFSEAMCSSSIIGTHQWWTYVANDSEKDFDLDTILTKLQIYFTLNIV